MEFAKKNKKSEKKEITQPEKCTDFVIAEKIENPIQPITIENNMDNRETNILVVSSANEFTSQTILSEKKGLEVNGKIAGFIAMKKVSKLLNFDNQVKSEFKIAIRNAVEKSNEKKETVQIQCYYLYFCLFYYLLLLFKCTKEVGQTDVH